MHECNLLPSGIDINRQDHSKEESWGSFSQCRGGKGRRLRWVLEPARLGQSSWGSESQNPQVADHFSPKSNILVPFSLIYSSSSAWQADKPAVLVLLEKELQSGRGQFPPLGTPELCWRRAGNLKLFSDNFPGALGSCPSWGQFWAAQQHKTLTMCWNNGNWYECKQILSVTLILLHFLLKECNPINNDKYKY